MGVRQDSQRWGHVGFAVLDILQQDVRAVFQDDILWQWRVDFCCKPSPAAHEPQLTLMQLVAYDLADDIVGVITVYVQAQLLVMFSNGPANRRTREMCAENGLLGCAVHGVTVHMSGLGMAVTSPGPLHV